MVERPGIRLSVTKANSWHADGPLAERALRFAQRYCAARSVVDSFHVRVESAAPEHAGFGVGTQLGLAIARGIAELSGQTPRDAVSLAQHVGRGLRSALGIHGFDRGGFLVEGGKSHADGIAPLVTRHDFPVDWQILLITPRDSVGTHGRREVEAFAELAQAPGADRITDSLCRLVLLGMLPALVERDLATFGDALYEFNRRAGAMFKVAQGGLYATAQVEELVKSIRTFGVNGVGQSSWGPTVFAIAERDTLEKLQTHLASRNVAATEEMLITSACNRGAWLEQS